jgi:hypothetical protein
MHMSLSRGVVSSHSQLLLSPFLLLSNYPDSSCSVCERRHVIDLMPSRGCGQDKVQWTRNWRVALPPINIKRSTDYSDRVASRTPSVRSCGPLQNHKQFTPGAEEAYKSVSVPADAADAAFAAV